MIDSPCFSTQLVNGSPVYPMSQEQDGVWLITVHWAFTVEWNIFILFLFLKKLWANFNIKWKKGYDQKKNILIYLHKRRDMDPHIVV